MTTNVLSFDVEDWFHCCETDPGQWSGYEDRVVNSTRRVLEILDETGTKATFFVLGDIADRHPELVEEIHGAGHEVGSHGPDHKFVYKLNPETFESGLAGCLDRLEAITGERPVSYRAPFFSITKESLWALPVLSRLGIKYDSSIFPVVNYRYGIPDAPRLPYRTDEGIIEVPVATYPLGKTNFPCGGGFYLRFFSYAVLKYIYRRLNGRGEQFTIYLHPWEFDPGQPSIPMERGVRIRHYWSLHKTGRRLAKMIRDFDFGPMREVIKFMTVHKRVGETFDREAIQFDGIYSGEKGFIGRLFDRLARRNIHERFDFTFNELEPIEGKTVFDAGCGSGRYCIEFAGRGAKKVTGVDLAPEMLDIARKLAEKSGMSDTCEFIEADILDFIPDEPLDIITSIGFFDYIPDPQGMLTHLASCMNGKLVASFPARWSFRTPFRKLWRFKTGTYLRFYSYGEIVKFTEVAGLKIEKLVRTGPNYMLVASND